jgi:hypothetical protein
MTDRPHLKLDYAYRMAKGRGQCIDSGLPNESIEMVMASQPRSARGTSLDEPRSCERCATSP